MESHASIGDYLIKRIMASGVRHVFGVPGDYVLRFFKALEDSPLQVVNTTDEQGAGFAADAYARLNGLGVVCVTYGVGGLKVANTTAGSFAEKVPVLVISGAPGTGERFKNPMLHHKVAEFDTQRKVFEHLTVASADLSDPETAFREIDRVLAAIARTKRPGYLELPRDMVAATGAPAQSRERLEARSEPAALAEALQEAMKRIAAAEQPVILAGEEVQRFGLQKETMHLAETLNVPLAVSIMGKSAIPETHPLYMGVYAGSLGDEQVRGIVEGSDCLILLGVMLTDTNLGVYTAELDQGRSIQINAERIGIGYHAYEGVTAADFVQGLISSELSPCRLDWVKPEAPSVSFVPTPGSQDHGGTALPTDRRLPGLHHGGRRGHRRCAVRRPRPGDLPRSALSFAGVLHLPGLCRAGRHRGAIEQSYAAPPGAGRRRGVPDDGHGAFDGGAVWPQSDCGGLEQPRVRHRTADAGRRVQ